MVCLRRELPRRVGEEPLYNGLAPSFWVVLQDDYSLPWPLVYMVPQNRSQLLSLVLLDFHMKLLGSVLVWGDVVLSMLILCNNTIQQYHNTKGAVEALNQCLETWSQRATERGEGE